MDPLSKPPRWDELYDLAATQDGYFTTKQAKVLGYSSQLLNHHVKARRLLRSRRGIYRLVHFPPGDRDELIIEWLWSEREGVFSHETALALHELSDLMPTHIHLSLPALSKRRRRPREHVTLHYADVPITDRSWIANVPATTPRRTLIDCAMAGLQPEFLRQAAEQALRRGLVARGDIVEVDRALRSFEGLRS
ncbi:MAG: type IV toxin-antitoxin system AbiEi family antitoxin domain-containing protein [Deltaproteobacteria bacterium]|nr:type IV toxin-antitoxin system AbiEi family antitoxin domain-containing protein [Deltaproteobacteria bacterium]